MKSFPALAFPWVVLGPCCALAGDCNGNGIEDGSDVLPGTLRLGSLRTFLMEEAPVAFILEDLDGDGLGDFAAASGFRVSIFRNARDGNFVGSGGVTIGSNPIAIAGADLDGNGAIDLVTANVLEGTLLPGNISVSLNRGRGDFAPARNFSVSHSPRALVCSDLDGDGSKDIAAATLEPGLSVLWNRGGGRFEGEVVYTSSLGSPTTIAAGDVDGDGDNDLVCTLWSTTSRIFVLRNVGGGRFEPAAYDEEPIVGELISTSLSDIDGDGAIDLAAASRLSQDGRLAVFWNDGDGVFAAQTTLSSAVFRAVQTVDLDSDGSPEVIAATESGRMSLWRNLGGGSFASPHEIPIPEGSTVLAIGDLEGDGTPDIVAGGPNLPQVTLLTNNGRGGLLEAIPLDAEGPGTAADLDGDGDLDLIASREGRLLVLENRGEIELEERLSHHVGAKRGGAVAADFDGDGDVDVAVSISRRDILIQGVAVLLNQGRGDLGPPQPYGIHLDVRRLQPADIDRDGDLDLVLDVEGRPSVFVLPNDGSGAFDLPVEVAMALDGAIASTLLDLDGDGSLDIVAVTLPAPEAGREPRQFELAFRFNDGGGGFGEASRYPLPNAPGSPVGADWNGDGYLDIALPVARCSGCFPEVPGTILLFLGRGNGTFYSEPVAEIPHLPESFLGADMDGDGSLDLIAVFGETGKALLWQSRGAGRFDPALEIDLSVSPLLMDVIDIDGDGDLDLATLNRPPEVTLEMCPACQQGAGKALTVVRNLGGGRFSAPLDHVAVEGGESIRAVDLDGDGVPELTVTDSKGSMTLLTNLTKRPASADRDRDGLPDECEASFHRGDSNGDGVLGIADAIHLLAHLFLSGPAPGCLEAADADDDGVVKLTDGVLILTYLYLSGRPPAAPGPPGSPCGPDPGPPGGPGDLGCAAYSTCAPGAGAASEIELR